MMAYSNTTAPPSRHKCEKKDKHSSKLDTEELKQYMKRQKELRRLREQEEFKEREKLLEVKKQKLNELNKKCKKIVMASEKKHEPREIKSVTRVRKEETTKVAAAATRSRIGVQNAINGFSSGSAVVKTARSMPTAKTTVSASNVEREAASFIFKEFENIVRRECKNMLRSKSCQSRPKTSDFDCSRTQRLVDKQLGTSFLSESKISNSELASFQGRHIPKSRKSMSDAVVPTKLKDLTNGFFSEIPRPPKNRASIAFMETSSKTNTTRKKLTEEQLNEAAAKIQAAYKGYRIRKILSSAKLELEKAVLKQQTMRVLTKQTSPTHTPVRRKSRTENQPAATGSTSKEASPRSKIPRSSEMVSAAQFKVASERLPGYIPPPLEPLYRSSPSSPRVLPFLRPKQIDEPFPKRLESLRSEVSQNTPSPLKLISSISKFQMPSYLKSKEPRQSRLLDEICLGRRKSLSEVDTSFRPSSQAQEYKEKLAHLRSEIGNKYVSPPRTKPQLTSRSRRTLSEHMYDIPDPAFAQVLQEKLRLLRLEKAPQKQALSNQLSPSGQVPIGVSQATVSKATEQIKQKIVEAKQILEDYKKELLLSSNQILSRQAEEPIYDSDFDVQSQQTSLSQSVSTGNHRSAAELIRTKELKIPNISPRKPQVAVRPNTSQSSIEYSVSRHERIRTTHTTTEYSRSPKRRTSSNSREVLGEVMSETKIPTPPHQEQFQVPPLVSQEVHEFPVQDIPVVPVNSRDDQASISSKESEDDAGTDYEDIVESKAESRQPTVEENYDTDFDSELQSLTASKQGQRQEILTSVADTEEHSFKQEALTSIADTEENSYDDDRSEFNGSTKPIMHPQAEVEDKSLEDSIAGDNQISEELPPSVEPSYAENVSAKENVVQEVASYCTDFDTDVPSSAPARKVASELELDAEKYKMSTVATDFEESALDSTIKEDIPEEPSVNQSIVDEVSEVSKSSFKSKIPVVVPSYSVPPPSSLTAAAQPHQSFRASELDKPKAVSEAAKATARRLMDELSESSDSDISTPKDIDDIMEKILAEESSDESDDEVLESADTNEKFKIEKPRDVFQEVFEVSPKVDTMQKLDDISSPLPGSLLPPATTTSEVTENWSSAVPTDREDQIEIAACAGTDAEAEVEEIEDSESVTVTKEVQEAEPAEESSEEHIKTSEVKSLPVIDGITTLHPDPFVELEPEINAKKPENVGSPAITSTCEDSSASEIIMLAQKIDASIVETIESMIVEEVSKQITVEELELDEDSEATRPEFSKSSLESKVSNNVQPEDIYESDFDTEVTSERSEKTSGNSTTNDKSKGKSRLEIVVQEEVESLIETKEIAVEFIVTGKIPAQPGIGMKAYNIETKLQDLVHRKELMESLVIRILKRLLKDVVVNESTAEQDIERIKHELTGSSGHIGIECISPIPKPSVEDDLDDSVHDDVEGEEWFEDDLMGTSHTEADEESLKIEAAKILAEQLRIEREIQALEALQAQASPQVPPPPPYSPPAPEPIPSPPSTMFTVQCTSNQLRDKITLVVNSIWESWTSTGSFDIAGDVSKVIDELQESCDLEVRTNENLMKAEETPSAISTRAFNTLLHNLIVDTIKEMLLVEDLQNDTTKSYVDRIRPGSLALEAAKLRIPRTKEALSNLTFFKISNLLPYPMLQNHVPATRKRMTKWTSRSRDLVDEVLAEELIDEDREWTESWPEEILVLDRWTEKFCRRALDQVLSDYETVFCSPANV